jgi:hypothetical protein
MDDELELLRGSPALAGLLTRYAELSGEDRLAWQPRQPGVEEMEPRRLSRLHGELIAWGWIEQNTGEALSQCYRVTRSGLRALEALRDGPDDE